MAKIIRIVIVILLVAFIGLAGFQWRNYHKKSECRDNALLYFKEKDYEKAIGYLEKGLKQMSMFGDDMNKDMSCYLAESHYQLGQYEEAAEIYRSLLEDDSSNETYYLLEAEAYAAMDRTDKAVEIYEEGWEETGSSAFLSRICDSYLESGNYEEALRYARMGVEKNESDAADFLFKEIVIFERSGDYSSAYDAAVEYTTRYPDDEKGQKELKFLSTRI